MPKSISTRMRNSDLGKPWIIHGGSGSGGLKVTKSCREAEVQSVLFDRNGHDLIQWSHIAASYTEDGKKWVVK